MFINADVDKFFNLTFMSKICTTLLKINRYLINKYPNI